jgi:hypothetical protein
MWNKNFGAIVEVYSGVRVYTLGPNCREGTAVIRSPALRIPVRRYHCFGNSKRWANRMVVLGYKITLQIYHCTMRVLGEVDRKSGKRPLMERHRISMWCHGTFISRKIQQMCWRVKKEFWHKCYEF